MIDAAQWLLASMTRELTLFAAAGLLISGIDDLLVDLIWIVRGGWRRATVYRRHARTTIATLPPPARPGRIAIFVAAWQEADVIGEMLATAVGCFEHDDYRIYVGTYPNDLGTIAAVEGVGDARVRLVRGDRPGPTTKAECLNRCWAAMLADERTGGVPIKAIVLHDAEDLVHPLELRLFDRLIERFDLVQLPVLPLVDDGSRWIAGSYIDEFAEAHGKQMVVREALGAGVPLAGTGCALSRGAIARIAAAGGGLPFDEDSLTEDYEIGLRLTGTGGRSAFVLIPVTPGGPPVAVRAYFPADFEAAVRQKARWMTGIALAGWDRLRWQGGIAEYWMRSRDRRAVLAAIILVAAYGALSLSAVCTVLGVTPAWPRRMNMLVAINGALLGWRLVLRCRIVAHFYGWREGLRAIPRMIVGNLIAMAAAWRAMTTYVPGRPPAWDKTAHRFPDRPTCG